MYIIRILCNMYNIYNLYVYITILLKCNISYLDIDGKLTNISQCIIDFIHEIISYI